MTDLSPSQLFLVGALVYGLFYIFLILSINAIYRTIDFIYATRAFKKKYKKYVDRHNALKEMGEPHEWVRIQTKDIRLGNVERLVCKKTGWCPEIKDYFTDEYVKAELKRQEIREMHDQERDLLIGSMAARFNMKKEQIEDIVRELAEFKQKFYVEQMAEQVKEMQNKK